LLKAKAAADHLLERNAQANARIFEYALALNSYYSALLDSSELPFFLSQACRPGKVQLDDIACVDRRSHGNRDENSDPADVRTSAIKKPIGLRHPDTDGPAQVGPNTLPLFC